MHHRCVKNLPRESPAGGLPRVGAEGATAPETLRQTDRDEARHSGKRCVRASTDGRSPAQFDDRHVCRTPCFRRGNLSGHRTEGARIEPAVGRRHARHVRECLLASSSVYRTIVVHAAWVPVRAAHAAACAASAAWRPHGAVRRLRHADPVQARASSPNICTRAKRPGCSTSRIWDRRCSTARTPRRGSRRSCPADIQGLTPGQVRYTQLLDANGNILDDLMVTRRAPPPTESRRSSVSRRQRGAQGA